MSHHFQDDHCHSDLSDALQELRIHQIELKMQNHELRRVQEDLERSRLQYFDLYNLAPVGYCTVSNKGIILEANLTFVKMLGLTHSQVLRRPLAQFIYKQDHPAFYKSQNSFLNDQVSMSCEVRMHDQNHSFFWAMLHGSVRKAPDEALSFRITVTNITKHKQAEEELLQYRKRLEQLVEERTRQLQHEVEKHKKAREALQESEVKYRHLFENAGDAVFIADAETGMLVDANQQALELSGYSLDTLRTMHQVQLHPVHSADKARKSFSKQVSARNAGLSEQVLLTASGLSIPVEINASGTFKMGGRRLIIGLFRDIRERIHKENKRIHLEKQLHTYQKRLSQAQLFARAGAWEFDLLTSVLYWTPECEALFGLEAGTFSQTFEGFLQFVHPGDREYVIRMNEPIINMEPERSLEYDHRIVTRSGEVRWVKESAGVIRDENDNPVRITGLVMDITESKKIEIDFKKNEQRLYNYFECAPYGIMVADENGNFISANIRGCEQTGYSREELLTMNIRDIIHKEDLELACKHFMTVVETGFSWGEMRCARKDGTIRHWSVVAAKASENEFIGFQEDITEKKQVQHELYIAKEQAEQASKAKTAFLANMSHELRTPMNAVLGFADILQRDQSLTPEQARKVRLIHSNGQNLLSLINEILDMSKIEAGKVDLKTEDFLLPHLLTETTAMFQTMAESKGLRLEIELCKSLPAIVQSDQSKLRQILINLIGNAIKFTKSGHVILRGRISEQNNSPASQEHMVYIEVEDTGPGISEKDKNVIFNHFYQTEAGIESGGAGLGLPISREYARLMGGDITVSTCPGHGSIFRLELAIKPTFGTIEPNELPGRIVCLKPGHGPCRILVADDKEDNLTLISELLQPAGFEIRKAFNGKEALKIFHEWQPHAVLVDMRMPVMDGYETTRRIKATCAGQKTFVVAITALAFKDSRQKSFEAGVDAYLSKPYKGDELLDLLSKNLGLEYINSQDMHQHIQLHADADPTAVPSDLLPRQLIRSIIQASSSGDIFHLIELSAEAEQHDEQAAAFLQKCVHSFNYQAIHRWLGSGPRKQ